jgi:hypothetical protein
MNDRVTYNVFRCSVPEGGEVVLYMPAGIGRESFEMAREMLAIQMRNFERRLPPPPTGDA